MVSPYLGALFENAVICEIVKTQMNFGRDWQISHWRTRDQEEVDFIVQTPSKILAIECKYAATEAQRWTPPKQIQKIKDIQFAVVSASGGASHAGVKHLSLGQVRDFLLAFLS
jgi:predicted AAA+ superfamily ATPase